MRSIGFRFGVRSDDRLLLQIKDGQLSGLSGLFDHHGQHCLRRARRVHGDQTAAEAAVFDAFMHLWRDPPERAGSLRDWLTVEALEPT